MSQIIAAKSPVHKNFVYKYCLKFLAIYFNIKIIKLHVAKPERSTLATCR